MGQDTKNLESEPDRSEKRRRLHKRTIVLVLLAIVPWILIAIPGTPDETDAQGYVSSKHFVHGWPLVHLDSTKCTAIGGMPWNLKLQPLSASEIVDLAWESVARHTADAPAVQLNLRLERDKSQGTEGTCYWTDGANWPVWNEETYFRPRFVGLFLNLICVGLFASIVAALCEYKIRRDQRLLKYSIATLLVGMAFLAVCVACIVQMYRENAAQNAMKVLTREVGGALWRKKTHYEPRFPLIVSQLFNHGAYPWGKMETSRRVKSGKITVDIDQGSDLKEIELISKCARLTQHSVDLRVFNFNSDRQDMLNVMGAAKIVALYLDFVGGDRFEIDLEFDKRHLEEIRLGLNPAISAKEQLEPFVGLPSLKWASIAGLSTEGAAFILETKTKWPKVMLLAYLDEVPEELKQKLDSEFEEQLPHPSSAAF